jgi:hypothetical protein
MKNLILLCAIALFNLTLACAKGPGSYYEGQLEVIIQISAAHEEAPHETEEEGAHWKIGHVHLHLAGIQLYQSKNQVTQTWEESVSLELSEAPTELFHFDAVAGLEYESAYLILGEGSVEEHDHEESEDEEEHEEEHLSTLSLEAMRESELPCELHLEIHEPGLKIALPTAEPFSVERDQSHTLSIEVDFNHLLELLPLEALCAEASEVHISEEENADLYLEVLDHFTEIFSVEFSSSVLPAEDSDDDHGHNH